MSSDVMRPHADSKEITVPGGHDVVVVRARDHTWVSLLRDGRELVSERSGGPTAAFVLPEGDYEVRTDGRIEEVSADSLANGGDARPELASLRLSADAPNAHPLDGVGELPADGSATCTITIEKLDASGDRLSGVGHGDEVFIRTTGGTLMTAGGKRLRSVRLRSGKASFQLMAADRPGLVAVHAFAEGMQAAELPIEFV
jgi:hypothetical protein